MKKTIVLFLISFIAVKSFSQTKTIHVFVALCDNKNQDIVPVPKKLGNGQDPKNNLYWGALYGVKSFFKYKAKDWKMISTLKTNSSDILERVLFKHKTRDVYLLADAYDGKKIKTCTEDFLKASNHQNEENIITDSIKLKFGGASNLIAYVGHDGLMEFDVNINYQKCKEKKKDVIILACFSKHYFSKEIKQANANPLLWTTNLMAPEAYTLDASITTWLNQSSSLQIKESAAKAYHKYQKCGMRGARSLFSSGF
ncbi:hypothetical protein [uncultured Tenacibaculum sp.]|uniref:hypothetical protein n=1 Tax=uncultured Tenacibaculum sp. TaxID=174713 RepID=UPI00260D266C|nr:hypothetical protein [uncultured Tenacibaculum sp.]